MLKWLLVVAASVVILGLLSPILRRLGLGRLPGDIHVRVGQRRVYFPITSTVLVSVLLTIVIRVL